MSLVESVTDTFVPKKDGLGRVLRIVVDVNMNSVREYVMLSQAGSTPWPVRVVDEMMDAFIEMAQRENMTVELWRND